MQDSWDSLEFELIQCVAADKLKIDIEEYDNTRMHKITKKGEGIQMLQHSGLSY